MPADRKRRAPAHIEPVRHGGLRYEAPHLGGPFGFGQDGGIVVARDDATGDLVWSQRVYVVSRDEAIEDDKQDVFVKSLSLSEDRQALRVADERGERFLLRLADRSVERLGRAA
jgi:hypothetical protein